MADTYLTVPFKDKDAAKALGARWDKAQKLWFVPEGLDLAAFATWLPVRPTVGLDLTASSPALHSPKTDGALLSAKTGVALSTLLSGVSQAIAAAYRAGVWVLVEVVELRVNNGHIFMGVSERDPNGTVLAKTSAVIWQSTANSILPEFERATGANLAAGIKLLVRARPVFKPMHGFSLEIDAIDPQYTLGDLEARKREIRQRLLAEGVFLANKKLIAPWDFNAVLVIAPESGAGLGDFQVEASRLEKFGVCRFEYACSRFQGEGAAHDIGETLQTAMRSWSQKTDSLPDCVVIIRGGGAVNDLAWLNDYDLARQICDLQVPVFTGIGHERDSTILDEVANTKFDTPSKVIAGIEHAIAKRSSEAKDFFAQVASHSAKAALASKAKVLALDASVKSDSVRHLAQGKQATQNLIYDIRVNAIEEVRTASVRTMETYQMVKSEARSQLSQANHDVPTYWNEISLCAKHAMRATRVASDSMIGGVIENARRSALRASTEVEDGISGLASSAKFSIREGKTRSEGMMREIAGQGPEKTLQRGFALVRDDASNPITRAAQIGQASTIEIQFFDGHVLAGTGKQH